MNRKAMSRTLILSTLVVAGACLTSAQDVTGDWQGTLSASGAELRLVLHIIKSTDGAFKATLDSVDQGANGIPGSSISPEDSKLSLGVEAVQGTYQGKVATDGKTITGTWSQGQSLPLDFKRATAPVSNQITSPWFRYFLTCDPATALRKVTCPALAINGEKDTQVPPKQNRSAIRKALEQAGNKHFEVDELPGLNHLFQTAKSGAPVEYAEIEETMSPVALEKVASWILKQ